MLQTRGVVLLCAIITCSAFSRCKELGFNSAQLDCGTCSALGQIVGDAERDCFDCCNPTIPWQSPAQFRSATLQVFKQSLNGGVNEFVEKSAARYKNLDIQDVFVNSPTLVFKGEVDGDSAKTIQIAVGTWKIEHIEQLLAKKLRGAAEDAAATPRT